MTCYKILLKMIAAIPSALLLIGGIYDAVNIKKNSRAADILLIVTSIESLIAIALL